MNERIIKTITTTLPIKEALREASNKSGINESKLIEEGLVDYVFKKYKVRVK